MADLWPDAVAGAGTGPPFVIRRDGDWREVPWDEADAMVRELSAGFSALGVEHGDRVGLLARTGLEWVVVDHALLALGAVVVPIYTTAGFADVAHVLNDSGARLLVCDSPAQMAHVRAARDELLGLETVVGVGEATGDLALEDARARGRAALASDPSLVERRRAEVSPDDLMTIVYTSGTTGPPKGCELTHRNWRAHVEMIAAMPDLVRAGDRTVLHLPLAHVFGRLVEMMAARLGLTMALCADPAHLPSALTAVRPTILVSVPRLFETARQTAAARVEEGPRLRREIGRRGLDAARRAGARTRAGARPGPALRAKVMLADRLVLSRIRARFGGELRVAIAGGAALAGDVSDFFADIGIPVLEGYGMTECTTVIAVNRPGRDRVGTVGPPVPGCEVKIAPDGEILVRGPHVFRGYHDNEDATRAVLTEDGWLRTGDIGRIDDAGHIAITDRKKDIIVTPGGKNVAPQRIEAMLRESPHIAQALVVGGRHAHIGALIEVDRESVTRAREDPRRLVADAVATVNARLGADERVRRFAITPRPFDPDRGEVTPTLKLRRRICEEHFADLIEEMYGEGNATT